MIIEFVISFNTFIGSWWEFTYFQCSETKGHCHETGVNPHAFVKPPPIEKIRYSYQQCFTP